MALPYLYPPFLPLGLLRPSPILPYQLLAFFNGGMDLMQRKWRCLRLCGGFVFGTLRVLLSDFLVFLFLDFCPCLGVVLMFFSFSQCRNNRVISNMIPFLEEIPVSYIIGTDIYQDISLFWGVRELLTVILRIPGELILKVVSNEGSATVLINFDDSHWNRFELIDLVSCPVRERTNANSHYPRCGVSVYLLRIQERSKQLLCNETARRWRRCTGWIHDMNEIFRLFIVQRFSNL